MPDFAGVLLRFGRIVILCCLALPPLGSKQVVYAQQNSTTGRTPWANLALNCVASGDARMIGQEETAGIFAFECGRGADRFVFMVNLSNREGRFGRVGDLEPLVPIFSSSGMIGDIPSIIITLPGDGTVIHENSIPPNTLLVFRPILQRDIGSHGLDE